jgi:site-specific DNA recombinase
VNVIAYCRCSTDKQENSIEAQSKRIQALADFNDYKLVEIIKDFDEFSGDLKRPGIQRVLELVNAKKIDAIIVTKLDRLTRSVRDAIDLIELFNKKGIAFISIDEKIDTKSPIGEFFLMVIASFAQLERRLIGSRTRDGLHNIKAQGFAIGTAPYGYRRIARTPEEKEKREHSRLEPNPTEQEVMQLVTAMRAEQWRWEDIAAALNKRGLKTRKNKPWSPTDPHRIWKRAQAMNRVAA